MRYSFADALLLETMYAQWVIVMSGGFPEAYTAPHDALDGACRAAFASRLRAMMGSN